MIMHTWHFFLCILLIIVDIMALGFAVLFIKEIVRHLTNK